MRILITGASGFIGSALMEHLKVLGHYTYRLSRNENPEGQYDAIINLAGEPLNKHRWNEKTKQLIYDSRINTTQKIIEAIKNNALQTKILISGSAIGFYDTGFTHKLCQDWECIAMEAEKLGVRVCTLRTGIVLEKNGGALNQMLMPFKYGLGAQLGDGKQWMSWIHRDDVINAIEYLLQNDNMFGPFNLTAPNPVTNAFFTHTLARTMNRPSFFKIPAFFVNLLFGEMGMTLLLKGQKIMPDRLLDHGYIFKFKDLQTALQAILQARP